MRNTPFVLNGVQVQPGQRCSIDLSVGRLYTHSEITMPVYVVNGKKPGKRLFLSAAIHGDEINGVEMIRRILALPSLKQLQGTLIAVPVVNVHGFINTSRYLPDRRDLNRSFPGSAQGSLTARLANLFMNEVVKNATHGIDLHTAAIHRNNLPQVRGDLDNPQVAELADAFGIPVLLSSNGPDGALRRVATEAGVPTILYEAGEALRFDEFSIRAGVKGIVGVLRRLGMLPARAQKRQRVVTPFIAHSSTWVRAPESGIIRSLAPLGARVRKGETLGIIADPFGEKERIVSAPTDGVIIGCSDLPLVNEGDALFHIARFEKPADVAAVVEALQGEQTLPGVLPDEPTL
ncbi:MAG: succinylglutamate desuccinylase [Gammaproteobacteria bacterium]|nr:succinylglutamate desuccinylase [Gammaproteobacteria bacterium]